MIRRFVAIHYSSEASCAIRQLESVSFSVLRNLVPRGAGSEDEIEPNASRKIFWDHFKKLGNHSSFYKWNLGSNRAQKWRKLVLTSFRSLRELRASFSFISVAERQRLKLGMLEEKDTNCSRRL